MIEIEFSIFGLMIAVLLILPTALFYFVFSPKPKIKINAKADKFFTVIEWLGRIGCLLSAILLGAFQKFSADGMITFFALSIIAVGFYYIVWIRYIFSGQRKIDLYEKLWFIPVPRVVFETLAIACFAIWGSNFILGSFAVMLAIGGISNGLLRLKAIKNADNL